VIKIFQVSELEFLGRAVNVSIFSASPITQWCWTIQQRKGSHFSAASICSV